MTRTLRRAIVAALAGFVALMGGQVPASGQPQASDAPRPCADSANRASCANQPLDAYRNRPPPPPPPPQDELRAPSDPLRPAAWRATLNAGRINRVYPATRLVVGGAPPYAVRAPGLPATMRVDSDGVLRGLPARRDVGSHRFTLLVRDGRGQQLQLSYLLRILGDAPPRPPTPKKPDTPPPPPQPVKPTPQVAEGEIVVYVLRKADLAPPKAPPPPPAAPEPPVGIGSAGVATPPPLGKPLPPPPPPPPGEPAGAPPAAYPTNLALYAGPLVDTEFTSRDLFEHALAGRYMRQWDRRKPPPTPLSRAQIALVADRAMERRFFNASNKLNWTPEAGCGCALPLALQTKEVYGFFPFWRSRATPPPSIIFAKVSRIGFLGAQLDDGGSWIQPSGPRYDETQMWAQTSDLARAAHAHGARLDLVLQRADWTFLLDLNDTQRAIFIDKAAREAVQLANTRLRNRGAANLLLPFWKEPRYVFDGITVMFDYPDGAPREVQDAFVRFQDAFILKLIEEMQKPPAPRRKPREYLLHIVTPDAVDAGVEHAGIWAKFLGYKQKAEPATFHRAAPKTDKSVVFRGRTPIRVRLIVPVHEPTSASKKALRVGIDNLTDVRGYNRVAVLQSILPIIYLPSGGGPYADPIPGIKSKAPPPDTKVKLTAAEKDQLDDDIIYYRQNFGGVAMWPAPLRNVGIADEVYRDLDRTFYQRDAGPIGALNIQPICSLLLRLLWQALVILGIAAAIAYFFWGQASARAQLYWRGMMILAVGFVVLSGVLLTVDPALAAISQSNVPLFALVAVALGFGGWRAVKPKIPRP